jgi:hypothetical protein
MSEIFEVSGALSHARTLMVFIIIKVTDMYFSYTKLLKVLPTVQKLYFPSFLITLHRIT